jgi:IS30 family transposase
MATFFCDTHSPWQKGGVENAIGRLRRTLPRKTDLASLADDQFNTLVQAYNNTPRKCLDYQTPAEIFWNSMLHFKCESTFRLSPESRLPALRPKIWRRANLLDSRESWNDGENPLSHPSTEGGEGDGLHQVNEYQPGGQASWL